MRIPPRASNLIAFLKLGLIHPQLLHTAWTAKKNKKTYLSYSKLFSLAQSFLWVKERNQGSVSVAEFGVGRGGSAIFLGWLCGRYGSNLTLYDVFGQIPPPSEKDGPEARHRFQTIRTAEDPDHYYGNIRNLLDMIQRDLGEVCNPERVKFVKGNYEETLPAHGTGQFHLVHVDCDWYESTLVVFNFLEDHLAPGGIIQLDDYAYWPGPKLVFDQSNWLRGAKTSLVDGALVIDTGTT